MPEAPRTVRTFGRVLSATLRQEPFRAGLDQEKRYTLALQLLLTEPGVQATPRQSADAETHTYALGHSEMLDLAKEIYRMLDIDLP